MSWLRIDDGFSENEKVLGLSDRAFRVHLAGLCHCAKNLTDGFMDAKRVKIIGAIIGRPMGTASKELVAAGLWEVYGDGFRINDYLEYNPSAARVKQDRVKASERQARWREKAGGDGDDSPRDAVTNGVRDGGVSRVSGDGAPSRPVPSPKEIQARAVGHQQAVGTRGANVTALVSHHPRTEITRSLAQARGVQ